MYVFLFGRRIDITMYINQIPLKLRTSCHYFSKLGFLSCSENSPTACEQGSNNENFGKLQNFFVGKKL